MYKKMWWLLFAVSVIIVGLNYKNILKVFYPIQYENEVLKYSKEYNLDEYMVYSLIRVESKFVPNAESNKDAIGLMQITTQTGKYLARLLGNNDYNDKHLYDPDINIKYGCFYFSKLLKDFDNDLNCALAAYNGGEGNVRKWATIDGNGKRTLRINDIPFSETRKYIKRVNKYYKIYKLLYTDKNIMEYFNVLTN
jgi:soluble lytic murein transglycosylase